MDNAQAGSFLSFSPLIAADTNMVSVAGTAQIFAAASSIKVKDQAEAVLARVKAKILAGDLNFTRGAYEGALTCYKQARAALYRQIHPKFDASGWVLSSSALLPVSAALEGSFIDASSRFLDVTKPIGGASPAPFTAGSNPLPDTLAEFAETGFQPARGADASDLIARSANLIEEGRPRQAISLIEAAGGSPRRVSASDRAALQLNLAAARIQLGDDAGAAEAAREARELFSRSRDVQGQALATHLGAVALRENDAPLSERMLAEAAELARPLIGESGREDDAEALERGLRGGRSSAIARTIAARRSDVLSIRSSGGTSRMIEIGDVRDAGATPWTVQARGAGGLSTIEYAAQTGISAQTVAQNFYEVRVAATEFTKLAIVLDEAASMSLYINHLYSFTLALKIGDALHALGRYAQAEQSYRQAASYKYLNTTFEATAVWLKLAANTIAWGDTAYKNEEIVGAKAQYAKLVSDAFGVPASFLYATGGLSKPAQIATQAIEALGTGPASRANAEIAWYVLIAASRMQSILDGLDFYGILLSPIHTFEYLQGVARGFAQAAIQAEREFVNFTTQQEAETATRRDLETMKAMAVAEAEAKVEAAKAAHDDVAAAQAAVDLAVERRDNAQQQRDKYASVSWSQIWATAAAQALGGGQSAMVATVTALADRLDAGETISGAGPLLAAAVTFSSGRKTRKYELAKMDDNIAELATSITIAQEMLDGAAARARVADLAAQASQQRADMAGEALEAFDSEMFTPEIWSKMAWVMRGISTSYLDDAVRIAKLTERAFNFENDTTVALIKNSYGHAMVNGSTGGSVTLLGGDSLLRDIESFTYQAITGRTRKNSRVKDVISVARQFPAQFEQFRSTGVLELETDLYEFDRLHPGFHNQRIEAVEVEFAGLLPPEGLNGVVSCGGVTGYRTRTRGHNKRVHQVDTMALSDFNIRNDLFVYTPEIGLKGMFQGMGLASTWKVHLPRRSNDFDYARIFDINLVLYYTAQFDPLLRKVVLQSPVRPGEMSELRNFDLRFDYPESWYSLYRSASASFRLGRERLPFNQHQFETESVNLRVVTKPGVSAQGISLTLTAPNGQSGSATTDATGSISTELPALSGLAAGSPVGDWTIAVTGGASLMDGGALKTDRIHNIQFGLEYAFEFIAEEV